MTTWVAASPGAESVAASDAFPFWGEEWGGVPRDPGPAGSLRGSPGAVKGSTPAPEYPRYPDPGSRISGLLRSFSSATSAPIFRLSPR
jgi:hypothetical protein